MVKRAFVYVVLFVSLLTLVRYGLGGIAVWRLGGEDPANWSVIGEALSPRRN